MVVPSPPVPVYMRLPDAVVRWCRLQLASSGGGGPQVGLSLPGV